MRVLLTVPPSRARLHQLVPLCWALRAAGHEVQVAGPPTFADAINQTGLVAVADDVVSYAELWRPAVVIWASPEGAAAAADALSVAVRGESEPAGADLILDFVPPSLGGAGRAVRYIPYAGPAVLPAWLRRKPRRPRVLLAAGDVAAVFAAVGGVDAEVICAADRVPPDAELPANVRLMDDLPLVAALPTCTAVIHDGSTLPTLAALESGLPQLAVTEQGDGLAARVAEQGAGLRCAPDDLHVVRLLTDPSLRAGAERLRDELVALPSPRDLVPELAALAAEFCGAAVPR